VAVGVGVMWWRGSCRWTKVLASIP
jgi:hypothetical protein